MTSRQEAEPVKADADVSEEKRVIFGQNCKAARLKAGMSQAVVAQATGISQSRLSAIEQGKINITLETMVSIAKIVDHDVSHLLRKPRSS